MNTKKLIKAIINGDMNAEQLRATIKDTELELCIIITDGPNEYTRNGQPISEEEFQCLREKCSNPIKLEIR